jgi:hypothetical protein
VKTKSKPKSWDGESRICTSPYRVKQGGCLGSMDFGQGIQIALEDEDPQRYCMPCHSRWCAELDAEAEKRLAARTKNLVAPA